MTRGCESDILHPSHKGFLKEILSNCSKALIGQEQEKPYANPSAMKHNQSRKWVVF